MTLSTESPHQIYIQFQIMEIYLKYLKNLIFKPSNILNAMVTIFNVYPYPKTWQQLSQIFNENENDHQDNMIEMASSKQNNTADVKIADHTLLYSKHINQLVNIAIVTEQIFKSNFINRRFFVLNNYGKPKHEITMGSTSLQNFRAIEIDTIPPIAIDVKMKKINLY